MVMTMVPNEVGGLNVRQTMVHPLIYLDHWAVRLFSDDEALAERFIAALHAAEGTWVFSQANASEFIAMQDVPSAERAEALIARAFPHFYVIDMVDDTDFFRVRDPDAPRHPDAPDKHWMLVELGQRALITNGAFNTRRFISDAFAHADALLPIFEQMKRDIMNHVMNVRAQMAAHYDVSKLVPKQGMRLTEIFKEELLVEPTARPGQQFRENDATDFVHALPSCLLCDMVLLDSAWCHKVAVASRRIRKAGIKGHLAECFSPRQVPDFLGKLEAASKSK
jgi:hypothetical protein